MEEKKYPIYKFCASWDQDDFKNNCTDYFIMYKENPSAEQLEIKKLKEYEPKMWNDLLYIMGKENFIEKIMNIIGFKSNLDFTEFDLKLLEYKQRDIDKYIESKDKAIIVKQIQCYQAGVVFAEQYHSELGNKLSELHPELDFIVIINPSHSVSYRTIKDIDLSVIAKIYNGGGHPKASGSPISDDMRSNIIDLVFS